MKAYSQKPMALYQRAWRSRNPERSRKVKDEYVSRHPKRFMVQQAKKRAKKRAVPFNLTERDFEIPEYCPVLGLKLASGEGKARDTSPSLDRIIPEFGYVPGNVRVMSWRANRLKSDGTADEHEKIASFMREKT